MIQDAPSPYAIAGSFADEINDSDMSGRDDYLTAGVRLRAEWSRVYMTAAYEMLTWKEAHRRTDEGEALIGGIGRIGDVTVHVSVGALVDGNLDGATIQNWWHRHVASAHQLHMKYRDAVTWHPAAASEVAYTFAPWEVSIRGAVTDHSWQLTPMLRAGDDSGAFGVGWAAYGHDVSPVAEQTDKTMRGVVLTAGGTVQHAAVSVTYSGRTILAGVGVTW